MRKELVITFEVAALLVIGFVMVHLNPLYLPGFCSEQSIMEKTSRTVVMRLC